jgi:hypothetical protein
MLIDEANEHRERAYIRGGDGKVIGEDPLHHAIADFALNRLTKLTLDAERRAFDVVEGDEPDEPVPYAVEPPLEFCPDVILLRYIVVDGRGVELWGRRDADSENFVQAVLGLAEMKAVGT